MSVTIGVLAIFIIFGGPVFTKNKNISLYELILI